MNEIKFKATFSTLSCSHARIKGGGGSRVRTPLEIAKLNIADISGNEKKLVIFHICALQGWTPLEKCSGSAPDYVWLREGDLDHF